MLDRLQFTTQAIAFSPDGLFVVELHHDSMAEDGPHAGDSIQGPVPEDLGFEFGLLCVSSVGKHLSEVPAGEL
ncbi:hypothetical protein V6N12_009236 [Hibiscus sabdariffa]|uniref:Uncharacterized protein n=1 Tax=Hibiscus sabdariffa TaxID=183260 RepID=A0ABR2BID6_9ROSI